LNYSEDDVAFAKGILKGASLDEKNEAYLFEVLKVLPDFDKLKEVIKKIKSNHDNESR
jgi:hypothetical protein